MSALKKLQQIKDNLQQEVMTLTEALEAQVQREAQLNDRIAKMEQLTQHH